MAKKKERKDLKKPTSPLLGATTRTGKFISEHGKKAIEKFNVASEKIPRFEAPKSEADLLLSLPGPAGTTKALGKAAQLTSKAAQKAGNVQLKALGKEAEKKALAETGELKALGETAKKKELTQMLKEGDKGLSGLMEKAPTQFTKESSKQLLEQISKTKEGIKKVTTKAQDKSITKIANRFGKSEEWVRKKFQGKLADKAMNEAIKEMTVKQIVTLGIAGTGLGAAISGVDSMYNWYALDNIMSGTTIIARDYVDMVQFGGMDAQEAIDLIEARKETMEIARNKVEISAKWNPASWAVGKLLTSGMDLSQEQINANIANIKQIGQTQKFGKEVFTQGRQEVEQQLQDPSLSNEEFEILRDRLREIKQDERDASFAAQREQQAEPSPEERFTIAAQGVAKQKAEREKQ